MTTLTRADLTIDAGLVAFIEEEVLPPESRGD